MRYAVVSDIHGNVVALEAVLAELADAGIDRYLCLGDIVGYGPRPNQCCDLVRELEMISIRGNHDEAALNPSKAEWFTAPARACILWTVDRFRDDNLEYIRSLPNDRIVDGITICHGSLPDPDHYTVTPVDALMSLKEMQTALTFFGHTHYAEWFTWNRGGDLPAEHPTPSGGTLKLEDDTLYLVNPGAVGQPRDGNEMASYAIYDDESQQVQISRIPYDIARTAQQMKEAGLPEAMHSRLWLGV